MDREVLRARLLARCEAAVDEAMRAVEAAPDGQWIAGSEWEVRGQFQKLMADCYQQMIQARMDDHPTAEKAAFSPSGGRCDVAEQGVPQRSRAHRQRRD